MNEFTVYLSPAIKMSDTHATHMSHLPVCASCVYVDIYIININRTQRLAQDRNMVELRSVDCRVQTRQSCD